MKILMNAEAFGFGPSAVIASIFPQLSQCSIIKQIDYIGEKHTLDLQKKLNLLDDFPNIWDYAFIEKHNTVIASSVMIHRKILDEVGYFPETKNMEFREDYGYWLEIMKHGFNMIYINEPLVGYDCSHGKLNY